MKAYKRFPISITLKGLRSPVLYAIVGTMTLLFIMPIMIKGYALRVIIYSLLWSIGAMGWNILAGYAGQLSLGHQVYFGLAGYLSALLYMNYGILPWINLIFGPASAMVVGLAIGYPCFRLRGPYFVLATLAFPAIVQIPFLYYFHELGGSGGLIIPYKGVEDLWNMQFIAYAPWYYLSLCFVLLVTYLVKRLEGSKLGLYLIAIREDIDAAESIGINTFMYKMIAMAISAFLTGIFGVLFTHFNFFIDPYIAFGPSYSVQMILTSVIGGMGTVLGPLIGSFIVVPISEIVKYFLEEQFTGIHLIMYGVILMVIVLVMPEGIVIKMKKMLKSR